MTYYERLKMDVEAYCGPLDPTHQEVFRDLLAYIRQLPDVDDLWVMNSDDRKELAEGF